MVQFSKLRLSGFKSFVDATELHIESGVTGVVGPNGCGKSNLVEALRWAMGENSAKRMRGGEMDDVIFSGSGGRPARNIAEVEIHLDNRDRSAPSGMNDEDELTIVRRIERGSGSHYRVNGREVRARDVQLLFADSSTGAHSTALVSQGRVGALINAKPTDRRGLLEEAAGITGLYSRRHEAELRLRAAETNLDRLDDVVQTLEAQLNTLKKQARQASRYRNLAGHIQRHEAILFHLEGEEAKGAVAQAKALMAATQEAVAELTRSAGAVATEQAEAAAALPALRETAAKAGAALQRLLVDRDNLAREEAQVLAAQERARQHLAEIGQDEERARGLAEDAGAAQARLTGEQEELKAAAEGESESRAAAETRLETSRSSVTACEGEVDRLTSEIAVEDARAMAMDRRAQEQAERIARLEAEAAQVAQKRASLDGEQGDTELLEELRQRLNDLEAALAIVRENADSAAEALNTERQEEATSREARQEAEAAQAKLEAEISALAGMLLPNRDDDGPPVLDSLTVASGLEAALGAALGDDLSASAQEEAPLSWRQLPKYDTQQSLPEGAEPLSAQVTGPQALDRRLSQIGLVPDAATGARLQDQLKPGQRLVTRAGDLWRWDGYTARSEAPSAAAIRLTQQNRLAELRADLPAIEQRIAQQRQLHEAAKARSEQAQIAERAAREAVNGAFAEVKSAREAELTLSQKSAAAETRRAALAEAALRLANESAESERAAAAIEVERAALPDLAAAKTQLETQRGALREVRAALAQAEGEVSRFAREAEARGHRLVAIAEEMQLWGRRTLESQRHLEALTLRRQESESELTALASKPGEIARRRDGLAESIESAEQLRKAGDDALAEGETRLANGDRALKAAEQRLAQAREERVRAEGNQAQCEQGLQAIREKVAERLSCGLDGLPELGGLDPGQELPNHEEVQTKLQRLLRERDNMGPVNLRAEQEAGELDKQITEMQQERADLISAIGRLRQGIASLNREGRQRLLEAFDKVNVHFEKLFTRLFGGGKAMLKLTEADDPLEAGLEIMASPPGKRLQVLSLLSGGEQALTALSLLFAVFLTNPAPICVLDEVDAPLDDANVERFCALVQELNQETQTRFLIITHHRITMARMDRLFGVTMAEQGVSQLVSVDLEAAEELRESA